MFPHKLPSILKSASANARDKGIILFFVSSTNAPPKNLTTPYILQSFLATSISP